MDQLLFSIHHKHPQAFYFTKSFSQKYLNIWAKSKKRTIKMEIFILSSVFMELTHCFYKLQNHAYWPSKAQLSWK